MNASNIYISYFIPSSHSRSGNTRLKMWGGWVGGVDDKMMLVQSANRFLNNLSLLVISLKMSSVLTIANDSIFAVMVKFLNIKQNQDS